MSKVNLKVEVAEEAVMGFGYIARVRLFAKVDGKPLHSGFKEEDPDLQFYLRIVRDARLNTDSIELVDGHDQDYMMFWTLLRVVNVDPWPYLLVITDSVVEAFKEGKEYEEVLEG